MEEEGKWTERKGADNGRKSVERAEKKGLSLSSQLSWCYLHYKALCDVLQPKTEDCKATLEDKSTQELMMKCGVV